MLEKHRRDSCQVPTIKFKMRITPYTAGHISFRGVTNEYLISIPLLVVEFTRFNWQWTNDTSDDQIQFRYRKGRVKSEFDWLRNIEFWILMIR